MKTPKKIGKWLLFVITILLLFAVAMPVSAQEIIIERPWPPPGHPQPQPASQITVEEYTVEAHIDGPAANVKVTQIFHNQGGTTVEGQFIFPLPADAAVSDLQMKVDDTVMEGQIMPADQARSTYEEIVRRQRDPALLQYIGQGLFQTNVFPIPPGESRAVQLTYSQLVGQDQGLYHFRYPLGSGFNAIGDQGGLRLRVVLDHQPGLRTIYSPNWGASVKRDGEEGAEVVFTGAASTPESFFDVYWGSNDSEIGANLLSYQPVEEDGYFSLLVAPSLEQAKTTVVERDIIVVVDVSGSMEGEKMQQARDAAKYVVDHLNAGDRLNLISFSTGVRKWSDQMEQLTPEMSADAHDWIDQLEAEGSTDINRALMEALAVVGDRPKADASRPVYLLFMTDGLPTQGETDPWKIFDNAQANAPKDATMRLFTFGVGYDVNTILLDTLSKEMGGRSTYVLPEEHIDEAVSSFYQSISLPVLTNVSVEFVGKAVTDDIYPYPLPDLFAGEQLVVAGRYHNGGEVEVLLRGEINGKKQEFRYDHMQLRERGGEPFVARVWASRKIGVLMEQIRRSGPDQEVVDAIVDLSLKYGIVTPYTSYLVQEPDQQASGGAPMPYAVPGAPAAASGAPMEMAPAAQAYAADTAKAAAAAPASGEAAVAASEAQNSMQTATSVQNTASAQFINGKTFVQQGWVTGADGSQVPFWVDTSYKQSMNLTWVEFASDAYFDLLKQAGMAEWLAVGQEVVIVVSDKEAIRVTANPQEMQNQGIAPASPLATPVAPSNDSSDTTSSRSQQNAWDQFWNWVWGK
jgi:Ca-activated chloride channel family protein